MNVEARSWCEGNRSKVDREKSIREKGIAGNDRPSNWQPEIGVERSKRENALETKELEKLTSMKGIRRQDVRSQCAERANVTLDALRKDMQLKISECGNMEWSKTRKRKKKARWRKRPFQTWTIYTTKTRQLLWIFLCWKMSWSSKESPWFAKTPTGLQTMFTTIGMSQQQFGKCI